MLNSLLKSYDFKTAVQHHAHLHLDDVQALTWLKKHFKRKLIYLRRFLIYMNEILKIKISSEVTRFEFIYVGHTYIHTYILLLHTCCANNSFVSESNVVSRMLI